MSNDYIYHTIYIVIVSIFFFFELIFGKVQLGDIPPRKVNWRIIFTAFIIILYIGFRPINEETGDSRNYERIFLNSGSMNLAEQSDIVFYGMMKLMHSWGFDITEFFLLVALIYVAAYAVFCRRYFPNNQYMVFVSVLVSLSFFGYGINGIRNGLAVAFFLLIFMCWMYKKYVWAMILSIIAIKIHGAVVLPIMALLMTSVIKNARLFYIFWIVCFIISISFGRQIEQFINQYSTMLSSHDEDYFSTMRDDRIFSIVGFRYDFLLYGMIPIVVSYYYIIVKKIEDVFYHSIVGIYVLCNSFWLLMAYSWLSNRYSFLSWFIYVPVILYPIIKYEKGIKCIRKCRIFYLLNYAFTLIMYFNGKFR